MDAFTEIQNAEFVQAARQGDYAKVKAMLDDGVDINSADDGNGGVLAKALGRIRHGIRAASPPEMQPSDGYVTANADRGSFISSENSEPQKGATHTVYPANEPAQLFRYREPPGANDPADFLAEDIMWPDLSPTSRLTALQWAALLGHTEITNLLLNSRADVKRVVDCRYGPLQLAARRGHHPIIFLLLANGVDINSYATSGRTALYLAAQARQLHTCQLLIDNGANVHARTVNGETPLFAACENADTSLMRLFLDLGSLMHIRAGPRQQTILHVTAAGRYSPEEQANHIEATKMILNHGVDFEEKDDGRNVIQIAESKGFNDMAAFLKSYKQANPPPKKYRRPRGVLPTEMKI